MQSFSYITNTKGEQEGILINFKDLKRLNLKIDDVIKLLKENEKDINQLIESSSPTTTLADALGKLKGKLEG
ncbi:hypothetical protein C3K47_18590 [Solitalea longa]|uniref:Uncharacterized protein n=1 Tax=Solitalea longa TaxID=2079460 RepID=A0A2S4ZXU5_9SPHI|nr:hypothetical protein [Solitalea longa]POY34742.1 hypothetical protein C3K47_18590 [Solitalea longa]